ncbi:MAG TPA: mycofactocin biosynthesis glycosyltransferase MftF [Pseudonocardia sp.]|nr:mycofactocin biosynthesis glycosyltransferase MftF [Pseudonocardia sp.]
MPRGAAVVLDRRVVVLDGGAVLLGGAPPRMVRLAPRARRLLAAGRFDVTDATSAALARRLLDAGIVHPAGAPGAPGPGDVTVVVPVKDRTDPLRRMLAALVTGTPGLGGIVVVDDGSADPGAVRAVATGFGARVLRHDVARGPAAARNAGLAASMITFGGCSGSSTEQCAPADSDLAAYATPLVAFLDSDVVPEPGWLDPLLACFADPAVALVAPRIVALAPVHGWLGRYEAVRSSLDLGPDPALVVPRSRVAYVPSAAMVLRREALLDGARGTLRGFDEGMRVAEDVDLVLRLHEAGWRVRYEPASRVAHDHRTTLWAWWSRKAYYGTGAAPLALRHPGSVPPMVLSPWSAAVSGLLLPGRPRAALAAGVVGLVAAERLARGIEGVRRPRALAARLVALGAVGATAQTAEAVTRHYWPVSALACVLSRRARRTVAVVALAEGVVDWWRHRDRDEHARPALPGYLLAHRLDDLAYGAGLWWGAIRHRTLEPLKPVSAAPRGRTRPRGPRLGGPSTPAR